MQAAHPADRPGRPFTISTDAHHAQEPKVLTSAAQSAGLPASRPERWPEPAAPGAKPGRDSCRDRKLFSPALKYLEFPSFSISLADL
jgi:hypothetical protein